MKKIFAVLGLAAVTMGSCTTDISEDVTNARGTTELTAALEGTRTHLGDKDGNTGLYKVYWSNGDCIAVNGRQSDALSNVEEGTASAAFFVNGTVNPPYDVIYPASAYVDGKVVLPAVQNRNGASFAEGAAVLVGRGQTPSVVLKNACGFVKIRLTKGTEGCDAVDRIRFYGNSHEPLCGEFDIDYTASALVIPDAEVEESRQSVILACGEGITLDADAEAFVVAVPAQTFAAGFTVEIVDPEGHLMRMRSDKEQVVSAGKMLAMPAVAFAPTETVAETEIRSAADMLALAENVRNGILGGSYYLAGDIDMAEVSDWKGIGVGDLNNAFNGTFDGRGFSIKNLKSAWPLFNFTLGESVIKNVTIDASCEFANTLSPDDKISLGALVGMGRGVVEDCVNNAKVSYAGTSGFDIYVGGLVGRIYRTGRISGCVNNGDVSAAAQASGKVVCAGGVLGTFDRSDDAGDTAEVHSNTNNGTVTNSSDVKTLCVGGVVGRSSNGTCVIRDCINKSTVVSNSTAVNKVQANRSNFVGGVSGQNSGSISGCTNHGDVSSTSYYWETRIGGVAGTVFGGQRISGCTNETEATVTTKYERKFNSENAAVVDQEHLGGVIGQCEGSIVDCTNRGTVDQASDPRTVNAGGICGFVRNAAESLSGNANEGEVRIGGAVTLATVGGVYGSFGKAQTVADAATTNRGGVTVSGIESIEGAYLRLGGIVGFAYPGTVLSNLTNAGDMTVDLQSKFSYYAVGGIAGSVECGASSCVNEGSLRLNNNQLLTKGMCKIFVGGIVGINYRPTDDGPHIYEDCANRAEIGFATTDNAFKVLPSFTGGILGYTEHPVEVRNCEGAAYINVNNANAKENGIFTATGGIVGAVKGTAALIEKCHVTADMRHYQYNNTWDDPLSAANGGGIVGCALGADEANRIAITGCSCSGMVESKRSGAAGIVGYARFSDISDCGFTGGIEGSGPHFAGGIAGTLANSTIAGCTVKAKNIYGHNASSPSLIGVSGIAAYVVGVSSVSDCKAYATLIRNSTVLGTEDASVTPDNLFGMGMIVGIDAGTTTVTNCGVGGSFYLGASEKPQELILTLDADSYAKGIIGSGKTATVGGCYYWNGEK